MFRSNLRAIQLLAIAKTNDIRSYGCTKLLHEFIDQMNLLADVCMCVNIKNLIIFVIQIRLTVMYMNKIPYLMVG